LFAQRCSTEAFYTDETHWTVPTAETEFTKDDINEEAPRRESMRMRRSGGAKNWSRVQKVVKATSLLRGSLGALRANGSVNQTLYE
jgi:hypothetical protein